MQRTSLPVLARPDFRPHGSGFRYDLVRTIAEDDGRALLRVKRPEDGTLALLKVLDPGRCGRRAFVELQAELEIAGSLAIAAVVRPIELGSYNGLPALALEDFDAESLGLVRPITLQRFLALAPRIAAALADVHREGIVHEELRPENILVHRESGDARLTGFASAARLPFELNARSPEVPSPRALVERSLPYVSPELTGRTDAPIDERADLYSLGIVFFELLTGQLPFHGQDALEWVHCHIARPPPSPAAIAPGVPDALAGIVLRLLAKRPEDRYQSARGLRYDLERCQDGNRNFRLGERDRPDRLQLPLQLVGREEESGLLQAALGRVAAGAVELVLVSGPSGVGKSSLVVELGRPVARVGGRLLRGKFDPVSCAVPYSTIVHSLSELVLSVLAEDEARLEEWRADILEALGGLAKLVVDVIPALRLVIGEPQEVPELPLVEAEVRFRRAFRAFLGLFAQSRHPLVLVLDDLQWVDAASCRFIEDALSSDLHHLLVLGAYRDSEVDPDGPLAAMLARLRAARTVTEIELRPLASAHVAEIVARALEADRAAIQPLAELVHLKAAGSPFFVIQFLSTLHREGLLFFQEEASRFRWDLERIGEQRYTDNVVELMARRLTALPARTRESLAIASAIGDDLDLSLLAAVREEREAEVRSDLAIAVREGFLIQSRRGLSFAHDRFRDAARALLSGRSSDVHLAIARRLLERTPKELLDEHVFEIAAQLQLGASSMVDRDERLRSAAVELRAARRARTAAAYASAAAWASAGADFLGEEGWRDAHELAFALCRERAECALCAGLLEECARALPELGRHARSRLERAAANGVQIDLHSIRGQGSEAIHAALECLREFGIAMAARPPQSEVERTTLAMWRMLGTRSIEELVELPRMADPEIEAAMEILSRLYIPAYYSDNNLLCLHLCHAVILSLRYGNAPSSSHAYGWFGVILITMLRRPREGYRFAKLGFDLVEHNGLAAYRARAHMHMKIASYWTGSVDEALSHTRAAFAAARESGDVPITCFACSEIVHAMISRGDHLGDVEAEIASGREVVRRASFSDIDELLIVNERLVRALRGATRSIATFDDDGFSEVEFESRLAWDRQPSLVFFYLTTKLMARFLALDYEGAFVALERARPLLWAGLFAVQSHWFHFFSALTLAARWERLPVGQRDEWLSSHAARLREWAEVNPAMFECDHLLVCAEIARARGEDAARLYDQAIAAAENSALVQRAALANELASGYYRRAGFVFIANSYLREARARYARWGADGKVRAIDQLHPDLVGDAPAIVAATPAQLDVIAITKASQAIASELLADRVGSTLLEVVLEHGGAQRGCLFLPRGPELLLRAEATVDAGGSRARVLSEHPLELCASVPISLLQLARRTRQPVLLADAREDAGRFASDAYIARERPRSVLALPVQRKSELVALLYLENSLVVGAFTSERLTALRLLVTQAAISFENASLFAKEQAAVAVAEEQRRRSSLIAEATALLVEPVGHEEALRRLAHLCVRDLADRCVIELMAGDEMQRLCEASVHPLREPREESVLRLPLLARGRTLGALSLGFSTRPNSDMELAMQLADRAALALDNGRLRLEQRNLHERLEQADRLSSLGTLAAGIGHEISNPLTYVVSNLSFVSEELNRGRGGEVETRQALSEAISGAARIRHIVSGLKQFSRQGKQERAPVDVRAELGTALDMTRGDVTRRARLSVDIPPSLPPVVAAPTELGQVFVNLLVNAAQAFPERRTASDTVSVSARAVEDRVVVEVRDTGAGIPADILKRIFDPFFTTKPVGVGTGLGLSICHRIVVGVGGNIEVESRSGEGTCFRVVLPVSRS